MAGLMKDGAARATLILALITSFAGLSSQALAQGVFDYPIPDSAREAYSPIGEGFRSPLHPRDDLRGPKHYTDPREARLKAARQQRVPGAALFFRDTELKANSRTYWLDEHAFGFPEAEALTTGGSLSYQSGFAADFLQLRSVLYTTQPLYANAYAGDTLNLSPDGDQITTFGQVHGRMKFAGQELTVGRQLVRTPYINPFDVRMIPLTFEGIVLLPESKENQKLDYIASYLSRYKPLNTERFIPLSEGLGVAQDEGVLITGVRYGTEYWNIGVANYWIKDTLNTAYGEVDHLLPIGGGDDGPSFRVSANILSQSTVGEDLIAGAPYDTYQASARVIASYQSFVFTAAMARVGDEAGIQEPFGFNPAFTSMLISSFDSVGQEAYLMSLSYDFAKLGLEGVKLHAAYGRGTGSGAVVAGIALNDQEELDLRVVYEPHRGPLQGLRAEAEYIDWQLFQRGLPSEELTQLRAIVNYSVPLL
jgi:hypothetical protein